MEKIINTSLPKNVPLEMRLGNVLAGNDFNDEQLKKWFKEEEEAFFEGDEGNSEVDPWYTYMEYVNEILGFSIVSKYMKSIDKLLVVGPGSGKEIKSFSRNNVDCKLSFLESSRNFQEKLLFDFPNSNIIAPHFSGRISVSDNSMDVICAFSVLHHIPNVSKVITEFGRAIKSGGFLLIREPCSSMGDWRLKRSATPNERGISRKLMVEFAEKAGFSLVSNPTPILFEPINYLLKKTMGYNFQSSKIIFFADRFISWILSFNDFYWRDNVWRKFGPSSYFYVFIKK